MKIAFFGSSLLSAYWNGAATYYRGLLKALAELGYDISFYEPDAFDRQAHRDLDPPSWARSIVYPATEDGARTALASIGAADVVVKASGVGVFDDLLLDGILRHSAGDAIRIFWDVDAAATLDEIRSAPDHAIRRALPALDCVFTYGGGPGLIADYVALGARTCVPVYNALDPTTHFPVAPEPRFDADLAFLGNRLPDREARVDDFFFTAAQCAPDRTFLLGGNGWDDRAAPPNVRRLGHVYAGEHNAFNSTPRAVLNIARDSMAKAGFSPATRVFEAAGAGACILTDDWEGIDVFLQPGSETLVVRDGRDVAECLDGLSADRAAAIGEAARRRVQSQHSYSHRAAQVDALLRAARLRRQEAA